MFYKKNNYINLKDLKFFCIPWQKFEIVENQDLYRNKDDV